MRSTIALMILLAGLIASPGIAQGHLQYFGYSGGADTDPDLTETYSFTNISVTAPACQGPVNPPYVCGNCVSLTPVASTIGAMAAKSVKAIVGLSDVLFCKTGSAPSAPWALRSDYVTSWQNFLAANQSVLDASHVASFYIVDEPVINGISASDLAKATTLVKNSFPTIPASTVEGYPTIGSLTIPANMDWIGIDEYGIAYPATDPNYQGPLATLKSKLAPGQKIIYVMDGYWYQGKNGWTESQQSCVASRWYSLAAADPNAVLLAVFIWPSSTQPATCTTDSSQFCGSADLPQVVRDLQIAAGVAVTGKAPVFTMFTRQVPVSNLTGTTPYEQGTILSSSRSGLVTAIRYFKPSGETGSHTGHIWDDATGTLLASVAFSGESSFGWQTQTLLTPLAISANHRYRVSYNFNTHLSKTNSGLLSPISNGPLTALSGCYSTPAGTFPNTISVGNYFADLVLKPTDSPPSYNCASADQGYHDGDGCQYISGWAWDSNQLNPPIDVDLYNGASLLAPRVPADQFRQDLLNAGIGNGDHAFTYAVPTSLRDGQPHLIRATLAGTQTNLAWTPRWITCGGAHSPYHGNPSSIPGTIQAEDFDTGGEGNAYHDTEPTNLGGQYRPSEGVDISTCTDGTGCYYLGWTRAGEWLLYTVAVPTAGTYTLQVRVASAGLGGTFHVELNGVNKTGTMTVPNTNGWDTWQTITKTVSLDAGWQVLRLVFDGNGQSGYVGNFNYLKF